MRKEYKIALLMTIAFLSGCTISPNVEVTFIDRHTIMEAEAAGEWPHIENKLGLNRGAIPFKESNSSKAQQKAFNVLNDEFSTSSKSQ